MSRWPRPSLGSLAETIVPARDKPEALDGPVPWVRIEDFSGKWIETSSSGQGVTMETVRSMKLRVFPAGAVVCTCSCNMGTTAIVRKPLITNQTFIGLVPRDGRLDSEFLYWALQGHRDELNAKATGAIQQYLSKDDFKQLRVPIPPIDAQRAIADYLDTETARIDALITMKEMLITQLKDRFDSFTEDAIGPARGPWNSLGRASGGLTVGVVVNPSTYVDDDGEIPFLRGVNVYRHRLDLAGSQRMTAASARALSKSRLRAGDVVAIRVGDPGVAALVPPEADGANCASLLIIRQSDRLRGDFLTYLLNSPYGRGQMRALANGAAQLQVNVSDAVHFKVPVRTPAEQSAIVKRLDAERGRVSTLAMHLDQQIRLAREHRLALITAAVTGELEIPGVAA